MNIETVYSEIDVNLGEEVNIESKILIDIDGNIFLSDGMLNSNFRIAVEESDLRLKLEDEMTCTVGAPNLRYCNNVRICGVLSEKDGNFSIGNLKSLELDFSDDGVVQIIWWIGPNSEIGAAYRFDASGKLPRNMDLPILNQGTAPTCGANSCGMILDTLKANRNSTELGGLTGRVSTLNFTNTTESMSRLDDYQSKFTLTPFDIVG